MTKTVHMAVNGTLVRGFAWNANLLAVEANFVLEALTEPTHRLWSLDDCYPTMMRVATGGGAISC